LLILIDIHTDGLKSVCVTYHRPFAKRMFLGLSTMALSWTLPITRCDLKHSFHSIARTEYRGQLICPRPTRYWIILFPLGCPTLAGNGCFRHHWSMLSTSSVLVHMTAFFGSRLSLLCYLAGEGWEISGLNRHDARFGNLNDRRHRAWGPGDVDH
jgi:hypothetical protein